MPSFGGTRRHSERELRTRDHEPEDRHDCAKSREAEREPEPVDELSS
jgi:hypothetical protein